MEEINWNKLDPSIKKVWVAKGVVIFGLIWLLFVLTILITWYYTPISEPEKNDSLMIFIFGTIFFIIILLIYFIWIMMYYPRYQYALGKEGILINRGIWWKYKRIVPYARIQHISIDQGPFE